MSTATKWEYREEYLNGAKSPRELLAALGNKGWELCSAVATTQSPCDLSGAWPTVVRYYFKRPQTKAPRG